MLRRMDREDGGVVLRIVGWLVLLAIAASAALFIYVRTQNPLTITRATVATPHLGTDHAALPYRADGRILVATFVRNTGRLPVTLRGVAEEASTSDDPFVATDLRLGDGETPRDDATAAFEPIAIAPGESLGVLVVYAPNRSMPCGRLPVEPSAEDGNTLVDRFAVRFTVYGIERTQTVAAEDPFAIVAPVSRADCQALATA